MSENGSASSNPPSDDDRGTQDAVADDAARDKRKAELEQLFDEWAQRRDEVAAPELLDSAAPRPSRGARDPVVWRGVFSAMILFMSAGLVFFTYDDFMYWWSSPSEPIDLGDLAQQYREGQRTLDVASNSYVKARGLFMTHELQAVPKDAAADPDAPEPDASDDSSRKYFICPLYDIVVQTTQPLPDKAWTRNVEIDAAYIELINTRRAFPQDLTVNIDAEGRIFRLRDAPDWAQKIVSRWYTQQLRVSFDPQTALILLDGETPAKYVKYAYFWGFALIAPLIPLGLLFVAIRRRRKALDAIGGGSPGGSGPPPKAA